MAVKMFTVQKPKRMVDRLDSVASALGRPV